MLLHIRELELGFMDNTSKASCHNLLIISDMHLTEKDKEDELDVHRDEPNPDGSPFSLQGVADGELYLDDGHSFSYRDRKAFCLRRFSMLSGRLLCR